MSKDAETKKSKLPLGCWILVYNRGQVEGQTDENIYRNHYVCKRLVTTSEFHDDAVPHSFITKVLGITALRAGISAMGERAFFLGRFYKTFLVLKTEMGLDPSKHVIKIVPANDCRFPKRIFQRKGLKEFVEPFSMPLFALIPFRANQLVFWDTPSDFVLTIGLTAAVVLFVFFTFKLVMKRI
ncbi:MAG: hypothetical protein ABSE82_09880 [Nitrososphaerales archaeon]